MNESRYISKEMFSDRLGMTQDVISGWMKRHWTRGREYQVIGHQTLVNIENAERWIDEYETEGVKGEAER